MSSLRCHKEGQGILLWFGKCLAKNCYLCVLGKGLTLNKPRTIICSNSFFIKHLSWVWHYVGHRGCDGEKHQNQPLSFRSWHLTEDRQLNMDIAYNLRTMWGKVGVLWKHIARGLCRSGKARGGSRNKMAFTSRSTGGVLRLS